MCNREVISRAHCETDNARKHSHCASYSVELHQIYDWRVLVCDHDDGDEDNRDDDEDYDDGGSGDKGSDSSHGGRCSTTSEEDDCK